MPSIFDSSAVYHPGRVLPQHQAVLTLIKDRVENPEMSKFSWLDLACGRGQIIANCNFIFSEECCQKIEYLGIDVIQEYCLQTEREACSIFQNVRTIVCEIDQFERFLDPHQLFDVVTLTNTVHEITPEQIAKTFVAGLCRLKYNGIMFIYDMESLPDPELGAIPWDGKDIEQVFHSVLKVAGIKTYYPAVSIWPHKSCKCWHMQINRSHLKITPKALKARRKQMIDIASDKLRFLLKKRLIDIHQALSAACRYGAESDEEQIEIERLLYYFWSISRALGNHIKIPLREL